MPMHFVGTAFFYPFTFLSVFLEVYTREWSKADLSSQWKDFLRPGRKREKTTNGDKSLPLLSAVETLQMESNSHERNIFFLCLEKILQFEDKIAYVPCDEQVSMGISISSFPQSTFKKMKLLLESKKFAKDLEDTRRSFIVVKLRPYQNKLK